MRLADLGAEFYRCQDRWAHIRKRFEDGTEWEGVEACEHCFPVDTLAEAQEVCFRCPSCFVMNGGEVGTHWIRVGFAGRGLLEHQSSHARSGQASRWTVASGTGLEDLTLTPSIDCAGGSCTFHGYITNGEAA